MNYSAQKSALTRAIKVGTPEAIEEACRKAVAAWDADGGYWPDDWSRWQRALADASSYHSLSDFVR